MQQTERNPLERFKDEHDAEPAVNISVDGGGTNEVPNGYMEPSDVVMLFDSDATTVGIVDIDELTPTVQWRERDDYENSDGDEYDIVRLHGEHATPVVQPQYVELVCDVFGIDESTFYENVHILDKRNRDVYPVVYVGETHSAIISPYAK